MINDLGIISVIIYNSVRKLVNSIKRYLNKKSKSKIELENEKLDFFLINFHRPLSNQTKLEVMKWGKCKIIEKVTPTIDINNPIDYMDNIIAFCSETIRDLIKKEKIIKNLLTGNYILVPPGMTSLALTFVTMFHGISGHFPKMSFFYESGMGYNLVNYFDFRELRQKYSSPKKFKNSIDDKNQNPKLINLSGRPLSLEARNQIKRWGLYDIIDKEIPSIDLKDHLTYMVNIINVCNKIINELIEKDNIGETLLFGKYIIIPHGLSSIAMVLTTMLHGLTGRFPIMAFFYKEGMIYNLTKPFNLQELRDQFRDIS